MEFGLVLAGGGTRGAAHVGVLLALEEEKIKPTSIAGTSAGSIVAGLYAIGVSPIELRELVNYLDRKGSHYIDIDYIGLLKFIPQMLLKQKISLSGLLKGDKFQQFLCDLTDGKTIKDAKIRTVIPAVDLNSGNTIAYTNSTANKQIEHVKWEMDIAICDAIMASSSVPAVFRPRSIGGYCFVDGGVTNVMPVDLLIAAGEKNVIAVDIGEDYQMPEKDTIIEIASHSFSIMSSSLKQCTSTGEKLLLKPTLPKEAGLLTFEHMNACMEAGYRYTKKRIPLIKKVLYNF